MNELEDSREDIKARREAVYDAVWRRLWNAKDVTDLLSELSSLDVVLKVEGELPENPNLWVRNIDYADGFIDAVRSIRLAGYTQVAPLTKEEKC